MTTVGEEVYRVLRTDFGMRPGDVFALVRFGSLISVRHALRELKRTGRCRYEGENMFRRYFKVEPS